MTREATPLDYIIIAAEAGDSKALDSLSKLAFGGNEAAQAAIQKIDNSDWKPRQKAQPKSMIWPKEKPKKGDVPLHLNV